MPKYKSRVQHTLKTAPNPTKKEMASKLAQAKSKSSKARPLVKAVATKVAPLVKKVVSNIRQSRGAAIPVGGVLPTAPEILSNGTIDQLSPHVFIHMMNNMDMPTFQILKGIGANYLGTEHPLRKITRAALGGDFVMPKSVSRIAMRDIVGKAQTPQQLAGALHSEWLDMMSGKLSQEEVGGGLFASLKTLVKKGVAGGKKALRALGTGAAQAVRAVSAGAMGAQHIGKSVNNALIQGLEVANALSPIIQTVFPQTEGLLRSGLGKAQAAKELLDRGINISGQVEQKLAPAIDILGPLDAPITLPFERGGDLPSEAPQVSQPVVEPVGAGLDAMSADTSGSDISGPRFVS